ncbi:MAG: histidinol-phosphatase HisJ family protein [Candidatus Caenarcaniphilales bacterium]|nr:histidinol-phosphatase HisJ family protein [Candidatus Caenarcaniphilales bacterium]
MPLISDYHNHPLGHDPNRKYTVELLTEWANCAKKRGLKDVALTDHDRYHEGVDFDVFLSFKESLRDNLKFRIGIELDNDPETSEKGKKWTEKNYENLDFVLGSVHFLDDWPFDHPNYKDEFLKHDINKLYEKYFKQVQTVIESGLVDGLAHFDLIKIFGYRPTEDLSWLIDETLDLVKSKDLTVELSTAGWNKPVNEIYPEEKIIQKIKEKDIPITIASDAHAPENLAKHYNRLEKILVQYQFSEVAVFENHKRHMIPIILK